MSEISDNLTNFKNNYDRKSYKRPRQQDNLVSVNVKNSKILNEVANS